MEPKLSLRHFDFVLLVATLLLVDFGVAMISSAIADSPDLQILPGRQLIFAGVGMGLMLLVSVLDYRSLEGFAVPVYVVTLLLLGAVLLVGIVTHGSKRWFDLGFFDLQPAELAKISTIIVLAAFFARQGEQARSFRSFLFSLLLIAPIVALIYVEPDLSTSLCIIATWAIVTFVAGAKLKYFFGLGGIGVLLSPLAWVVISEYQRVRILDFIDPGRDPSGSGYNIRHALIAIGSGGLFGKGFTLGSESQLRFLRVRWSDFIFSVIGEEMGTLGIALLFLLFIIVILRLMQTAGRARDTFGALIAAGLGGLLLFQSAVNIGMNLGLLPATGIPLPFVSAGGSSLITFLIGQGLAQSVAMRRQKIEFRLASRV